MDYNSYTSYGTQGGGGGGGFIPGDSSQSSPGANRSYGKDTLRPVTIKQLNDAQPMHQESEFKIDGSEVTQVTFVGQIRNTSTQTTNVTYRLDDGTGTIEVKQWIDSDSQEMMQDSANPKPKLVEDGYARVFGKLKSFNNKRHVGAQVIRPIPDYNEISYHMLEATVVHLFFLKGPPDAGEKKEQGDAMDGVTNGKEGGGGGKGSVGHLPKNAQRVYNCLKTTPQSNEGLHVQDIAGRLGMDSKEVQALGDRLLNDGMIYTTIDDSTWAILDM